MSQLIVRCILDTEHNGQRVTTLQFVPDNEQDCAKLLDLLSNLTSTKGETEDGRFACLVTGTKKEWQAIINIATLFVDKSSICVEAANIARRVLKTNKPENYAHHFPFMGRDYATYALDKSDKRRLYLFLPCAYSCLKGFKDELYTFEDMVEYFERFGLDNCLDHIRIFENDVFMKVNDYAKL